MKRTQPMERSQAVERAPEPPSRIRLGAMVAALAAIALVLWGGYGHHWPWTGINGHTATLWAWLHLLLLPLLLPTVVVPALAPLATARMIPLAGDGDGDRGDGHIEGDGGEAAGGAPGSTPAVA